MSSTEVTINEIPEGMEAIFGLENNLEGVTPKLPQIDIAHTVQLFRMPDDSKVESFKGIILDQQATNAYWKEKLQPGITETKPPDCSSMDAIVPLPEINFPQAVRCKECPMNQYLSDGKGKACKNMKRMHILMEGSSLPRRLTASATSIKATEKYLTDLVDLGLSYRSVLTEFSLTKELKGDIKYSILEYKFVRKLVTEELLTVGNLVTKSKDDFRSQAITQDEYMPKKSNQEEKYDEIDRKYKEERSENKTDEKEPESDIPF